MNPNPIRAALALSCALALAAGAAFAAEPSDPKAEPAESHHGGGDAMQHDRTAHPVEGDARHGPRHGDRSMRGGLHARMMMMSCLAPFASSGDADTDFALRMRHHHQSGVRMADVELAKGTDAAMKAMATRIRDAQQREIVEFDRWLAAKNVRPEQHSLVHRHFATMDADGDGAIARTELTDAHPLHRHFAAVDTDADGRVVADEMVAFHGAICDGTKAPLLTGAPRTGGG